MRKHPLVRPFVFLELNQCPKCTAQLQLKEVERTTCNLDSTGIPLINTENEIDSRLVCSSCGAEYIAAKKGLHYFIRPKNYVPEEESSQVYSDYNPFYT